MADKAATVFVVDCGRSMGFHHAGREKSDLKWMWEYVEDAISDKIFNKRKTELIGAVGFRTDMHEDDHQHTVDFAVPEQFHLENLLRLKRLCVPSSTDDGDLFLGLVRASNMIRAKTRTLKYTRRIIVVTNAEGSLGLMSRASEVEDWIQLVNGPQGIRVDVFVCDMGDEDKAGNVTLLRDLCDRIQLSQLVDYREVYEELALPKLKPVRPVKLFAVNLRLGHASLLDTNRAISIEVEGFACLRRVMPMSSKGFAFSSDRTELKELMAVRDYYVDMGQDQDKDDEENRQYVEEEQRVRGYLYGSELVPVGPEVEALMYDLDTQPGLDIVGFSHEQLVLRPAYILSEANFVVAAKDNRQAAVAVASLARALYFTQAVAIARFVKKQGASVEMVALIPKFDDKFEALVMVQLPFDEDVRDHLFPSLTEVRTKSGQLLAADHPDAVHRLPTEDMQELMDRYVDEMNLMEADVDDDGQGTEYMTVEETYNPVVHRLRQVVKHAALTDNIDSENFPEIPPILTKFQHPPQNLMDKAANTAQEMGKILDLQVVPSLQKLRDKNKSQAPQEALTGLDVDSLLDPAKKQDPSVPDEVAALGAEQETALKQTLSAVEWDQIDVPTHVTEENAVADLRNIVAHGDATGAGAPSSACEEMGGIIISLLKSSMNVDDRILIYVETLFKVCQSHGMAAWFDQWYSGAKQSARKRISRKLEALLLQLQ